MTPEIFEYLSAQEVGAGGEIQLTDAIRKLNQYQRVYAYQFYGTRYDVGEKLGFILTTLDFAMRNNELRGPLIDAMVEILGREAMSRVIG